MTQPTEDTATPEVLFTEIVRLLESPPFSVDPGFQKLTRQPPYRALVAVGHNALKFCMARLKEGAVFLIPAVLEIWQVSVQDLGLEMYATDQQVAARLVAEWEELRNIHWTAEAASPTTPPTVELVTPQAPLPVVSPFRFGSPITPVRRQAQR